jgi:hypothetical protein
MINENTSGVGRGDGKKYQLKNKVLLEEKFISSLTIQLGG